MSRKRTYLDYAATTPLDPRVRKAMEPFFFQEFGNPSSIHAEGATAKKALLGARTTVARCLEAHADEIVFTSGGTEANNAAIFGVIAAATNDQRPTTNHEVKPHMVTTNIEHASVLEPLRELEREGRVEVTYVSVEPNGIVKPENIIAAIRSNTVLVSVMYANNEIGTIQPLAKIGKALRDLRNRQLLTTNYSLLTVKNRLPIFHTDACQAPLYLHCLVNALGVDLMTLDGHKIYGPKGVGAFYVRRNTPLAPVMLGGGQERGLRSTTENVPAIVGLAEALRIASAEREKESRRIAILRDHLYLLIRANKQIDERVIINGSMKEKERLPNNLNISLPGSGTEFLILQLDARGVAASTKSSCLKEEKESYVVAALGPPPSEDRRTSAWRSSAKRSQSTLRFTLGRYTTKRDVEYSVDVLKKLLKVSK